MLNYIQTHKDANADGLLLLESYFSLLYPKEYKIALITSSHFYLSASMPHTCGYMEDKKIISTIKESRKAEVGLLAVIGVERLCDPLQTRISKY